MKSMIRLFKAVPIESEHRFVEKNILKEILSLTLPYGFVLSKSVISNYSKDEILDIIDIVKDELIVSSEQMNASFHKSWDKVRNVSNLQLVMEQLIHYFTTYGYEMIGIGYQKGSIYIPPEELDIPELREDIILLYINGYTLPTIKDKLMSLLSSGIAMKGSTIKDAVNIAETVSISEEDINKVKNKETKVILYKLLDIIPKDPVEFLRYIVFRITDSTLLIKSRDKWRDIRTKAEIGTKILENAPSKSPFVLRSLFDRYKRKYGLKGLAKIFYRFKPLFLAMRSNERVRPVINKIRRLAVKYHEPMKEDYLNTITARIARGEKIDKKILKSYLNKVNIFRKMRLLYALRFRCTDATGIMYHIRNGKSFATSLEIKNKSEYNRIYNVVLDDVTKNISPFVKDKKIYIPYNISYVVPATEKQFVGNIPVGSYVMVDGDIVFGIHWTDVDTHRIDLDLSIYDSNIGKIGWNTSYRSHDRSTLFSGDLTAAPPPHGASELFYVENTSDMFSLVYINYYNYRSNISPDYKIFIGKEDRSIYEKKHMLDPNKVICTTTGTINRKQKMIGLLVTENGVSRFYFMDHDIGKSIVSSEEEYTKYIQDYLLHFYNNTVSLAKMLSMAGAVIVDDPKESDIDLSPNKLEKDTIISLLTNK